MIARLGAAFLTGVPSWDGRMLEASSVSASEGQSLRVLLRRANEAAMGRKRQSACGTWSTQGRVRRLRRRIVADLEESLIPRLPGSPPPQSRRAIKGIERPGPSIHQTEAEDKGSHSGTLSTPSAIRIFLLNLEVKTDPSV